MAELLLDEEGLWFRDATRWPCPNHDQRPPGTPVELVVIHGISLPPGQFGTGCVQALFCNELDWDAHPYFLKIKGLKVSSHILIERDGALHQFVPLDRRAWHAGQSKFQGRTQCNDFSVGIELEGTDDGPYAPEQYRTLEAVLRALIRRFPGVTPDRVVGHCHVAPGRKTDPGPHFEWRRVREL